MPDEHFSPYPIEIKVVSRASKKHNQIFQQAAERWRKVIWNTQPPADLGGGELTHGLRVEMMIVSYEFPGGRIAESIGSRRRQNNGIPALGVIKLNRKLLGVQEEQEKLLDTVSHEIGHLLGFSWRIWNDLNLIAGAGTAQPKFMGPKAMREYAKLLGRANPEQVPMEPQIEMAASEVHWNNGEFGNELMTSPIEKKGNPLSRLTLASLEDIGYKVKYDAADPYKLPTLEELIGLGSVHPGGIS